jgi:sphingosine kinase
MIETPTLATPTTEPANPFADTATTPSISTSPEPAQSADLDASDVLNVDRNATLTLGTDALIVLDEGLRHRRAAANCCGLLPSLAKTTKAIPFYNVLWAELSSFDLTVHYAQQVKKRCAVTYINYALTDKSLHDHAKKWVEKLLSRAYPANTTRRKRIKVLINPFGGLGNAQKLWQREVEPVFAAARCEVEVEKTAYRGHAAEIAEQLDVDAYDVVACASGDGLPHEVFNGLARQKDAKTALRKVAVVQLPCGSGNAMSLNLNGTDSPSLAALAIVKGVRTPLDLVAITQGSKRYYSFLSQAVGIIAETDLGTESLRWMGPMRFTWGVLVRLLGKEKYPAEIAVALEMDDKKAIKAAYRDAVREQEATQAKNLHLDDDPVPTAFPDLQYGTVQDELPPNFQVEDHPTLGNFYVGNMCWMTADAPFFAPALPSDGKMDMLTISASIPRFTGLRMLATSGDGGLIDFPEVSYRKVAAYRITPKPKTGSEKRGVKVRIGRRLGGNGGQGKVGECIAIDGESVPFEPFQAEVVKGLGTVLSKRGGVYEYDGLRE